MPADFYIDAKHGMVYSKATGVLDRAAVLDHMDRLSQHPEFRPEFNQLLDFRETTKVELTAEQVQVLAMRKIFSERSKRAFVVSSDLQYGLSRVFEAYRNLAGEKGITIFREMPGALSWLGLSAEPDPKLFTKLNIPTDEA
jgi:hypothetical protein